MFKDGNSLRSYREEMGLSQAKLAEVSGIPQHLLSAFELGKAELGADLTVKLRASFEDDTLAKAIIARKKRYRTHAYSARTHEPSRVTRYKRALGNAAYRQQLDALEQVSRPAFTALSLFAGCGGLSLGFRSAGCVKIGRAHV